MVSLKTIFSARIFAAMALSGVLMSVSFAAATPPAADFSLPSRDGKTVALKDLKGQVVMVNFWASWCGPCRQEFPLIDKQLYQRYRSLGFTVLGVNVESDTKDAERFLSETPVTFPILFDKQSVVSKLYSVNAMPTTVFIDRKGNVRFEHHGYKPGDEGEYLNQIRSLVKEPS
jgi:peroxiredoxin